MNATELKSVLGNLATILRLGGAKTPAGDVDLLAARLDDAGGKSASAAIDELKCDLRAPVAEKLSPDDYIRLFKAAERDAKTFDKVFAKLSADKAIKKDDAIAILAGYAGPHVRAKTKKAALEEIKRRFTKLIYDATTDDQAASTPW